MLKIVCLFIFSSCIFANYTVSKIPKFIQYKMFINKSYTKNCPVKLVDLRYIKVGYFDDNLSTKQGELIVHKDVAIQIVDIFKELYISKFPIHSIKLIDDFKGDDNLSMRANNTSSYNCRVVPNTNKISKHAYGLAIDINPKINPYIKNENIMPSNAKKYVNRKLKVQGMIKKGDVVYKAFIKRGWKWGGDWKYSKDYQHFYKNIKGIVK